MEREDERETKSVGPFRLASIAVLLIHSCARQMTGLPSAKSSNKSPQILSPYIPSNSDESHWPYFILCFSAHSNQSSKFYLLYTLLPWALFIVPICQLYKKREMSRGKDQELLHLRFVREKWESLIHQGLNSDLVGEIFMCLSSQKQDKGSSRSLVGVALRPYSFHP